MSPMDQETATAVLDRFGNVIQTVAGSVAQIFSFVTEVPDVEQEASILVLSYAGLVPGGRLPDELAKVEALVGKDNEGQIQRLIAKQLRLDLNQKYGREADKKVRTHSLTEVMEGLISMSLPDITAEDITPVDYPYLHAHYVSGMTGAEIADAAGIARSTATRRIAGEKRAFVMHYVKSAGLVVEGDESTDELIEAYANLKNSGRQS